MQNNFYKSLDLLLTSEGGYVDDPLDPGGATNKGITLKTYRKFYGSSITKEELKIIPDYHVSSIYENEYWNKCSCNSLPPGIDYMVFDCAAQSGVSKSSKLLQNCCHKAADGLIGPITLKAVNDLCNTREGHNQLVIDLYKIRLEFLKRLTVWEYYSEGFLNRCNTVISNAFNHF